MLDQPFQYQKAMTLRNWGYFLKFKMNFIERKKI